MSEPTKQQRVQTAIARALLSVLLLIPVGVYLWKFGWEVTADHQRWSEFGSAMGGIYTPVLALLTLAMLIVQLQMQGRLNAHTFDSAWVQDARADLNFYYGHLLEQLDSKIGEDLTVKAALVKGLAYLQSSALTQPPAEQAAQAISQLAPRIEAIWQGVNSVVAGLKAHDSPPFKTARSSAKSKAVALFGFETCVALDNLCWVRSKGKLAYSDFSDAVASVGKVS